MSETSTNQETNQETNQDQTKKHLSKHVVCHNCSNVAPFPEEADDAILCERCGHENNPYKPKSPTATFAFSLTALILYFPANLYPFMSIEMYGSQNSSTIWQGVVTLAKDGSWGISIVVLLASIVIPFLKLMVLFYLSWSAKTKNNPVFNTKLYHVIEAVGRWSMLDIFILAILVTIMKLGPFTHVAPELGSYLFLGVVIFTMLASSQFDPKALWEDDL